MSRRRREKRIDPALQILWMRKRHPQFTASGGNKKYVFTGHLQPNSQSKSYQVAIHYRYDHSPRVFVRSPALHPKTPHLYDDGSLCLFKAERFNWHDGLLISEYIVPWTAVWLYFYEQWLDLNVWLGPEAPHSTDSEQYLRR